MEPLFIHGKKRISDSEISNQDARKISGELGFNHSGERCEFEKALHGPVTREKIHEKLQEMVAKGIITEKKAKSVINQLGIERKDLRTFKDISEYNATQKNKTSKNGGESAIVEQHADSKNNSRTHISARLNTVSDTAKPVKTDEENEKTKPASIYNILRPKF